MPEIVALAMVLAGFFLLRHYAARQVIRRRGGFMWAFAFPMVLMNAVVVWTGLRLLATGQLFGALLVAFGSAIGMVEILYFRRASRAVSASRPDPSGG